MATLEEDMTYAARDLLGDGYHRDFYRNAASEFIQIAESHAARAVENAKSADKAKVEKALKSTVEAMAGIGREARKRRKKMEAGPRTHFLDGQLDVADKVVAALKELIPAATS